MAIFNSYVSLPEGIMVIWSQDNYDNYDNIPKTFTNFDFLNEDPFGPLPERLNEVEKPISFKLQIGYKILQTEVMFPLPVLFQVGNKYYVFSIWVQNRFFRGTYAGGPELVERYIA